MKTLRFETQEDWFEARRGKFTGSTLKDVVPTGGVSKKQLTDALDAAEVEYKKSATIPVLSELLEPKKLLDMEVDSMVKGEKKIGYYQLIADRLADPKDPDEPAIERGNALEAEAIEVAEKELKLELCKDKTIWVREDSENIAISPDTFVEGKKIEEAVEVKCLSSAKHIKAKLTGEIPSEYVLQKLQYFVVNDDLKRLRFAFYDPRFIEGLQIHFIEFRREDLEEEITKYLRYQLLTLEEVEGVVKQFTF